MAQASRRLPQNAPGDFFVDSSCIDCDLCRQIAPDVFDESLQAGRSYVKHQPGTAPERLRAQMALVACPTGSIGTLSKMGLQEAVDRFPEEIDSEVYFCGFAAASSYGASSYFIRRPGGNVLVDSPRASRPLLQRLEAWGGIRWMFLTHRDDVADHRAFAQRFGCERVLHRADVSATTSDVELLWEGDEPLKLAEDLQAIPVPGHTRGSAALLYGEKFLFTGDHLWADGQPPRLAASRQVCWYSWTEQQRSMQKLLAHDFQWVLPGHGRRFKAESSEHMRGELARLCARMQMSLRR